MKQFWFVLFCLAPSGARAADFGLSDIQVHGTLAQGGLLSSHNDFLTAPTSRGTLQWTDAALNAAKDFNDRFRAGLQLHSYRLGEFGKFKVEIDWAYGEFRVADWIGIRAGKVKTRLGLFNDTQDIDALHLWSLLPQGVYPADNRSWMLSHTGGDLFGNIKLPAALGRISYQGYIGRRVVDSDGGYLKLATDEGFVVKDQASGRLYGGDLRWQTPVDGLLLGASLGLAGVRVSAGAPRIPVSFSIESTSDTSTAFYGQWERGNVYAAGEFRRRIWNIIVPEFQRPVASLDSRAWYLMGAYRLHRRIQLGAYCSRSGFATLSAPFLPYLFGDASTDWVVASRIDLNPHVYLKFEGHYMGGGFMAQGFYPSTNPGGPDRLTRLAVARLGFTF